MVGLAETAAAKTMVRSHTGIRGAFVVETASEGKSGLAIQLEGSCFETVWQLKEGDHDGILNLNKVCIVSKGVFYLTVFFTPVCEDSLFMTNLVDFC